MGFFSPSLPDYRTVGSSKQESLAPSEIVLHVVALECETAEVRKSVVAKVGWSDGTPLLLGGSLVHCWPKSCWCRHVRSAHMCHMCLVEACTAEDVFSGVRLLHQQCAGKGVSSKIA